MTDLAPAEAYRKTPMFPRTRMGLLMALLFGVLAALGVFLVAWLGEPRVRENGLKEAVGIVLLVAGAGFLFPYLLDFRVRMIYGRAIEGEGLYAAAPPPAGDFTHRLLCSLVRSPSIAAGGFLYVGPTRIVFAPHSLNLPKDRHLVEIPREPLSVSLRPAQLTPFQRLLIPNPPEQLVLTSGDSSWTLVVPTPERVRDALAAVLRSR